MIVTDTPHFPPLPARRLRVGEIFDAAAGLFRAHWLSLLVVAAVVNVPLTTMSWFATRDLDRESLSGNLQSMTIDGGITLLGAVATLAFMLIAVDALEGRVPAPGPLLARALALWPRALLTCLLGGVIVWGLLLCLVAPGVIWAIYYTFMLPAVVLRGLGGKPALDYSKSLVVGRWWRTLGITFVMSVPALTVGLVLALPGALAPESLVMRLGIGVASALAGAFQVIALVLFFRNEEEARAAEAGWIKGEPRPAGGAPRDPGPIYPP